MNAFSALLATGIAFLIALHGLLTRRQLTCLQSHRERVPEAFAAEFSLEEHRKAGNYAAAKARFLFGSLCVELILVLLWTLGGGLHFLWRGSHVLLESEASAGIAFLCAFLFLQWLLEQPLRYRRVFSLEQRFGFNRASRRLHFTDQLKGLLIGAGLLFLLIGGLFLALELAGTFLNAELLELLGGYWWLLAAGLSFGLLLLMNWFWPAYIAPLFNKFKALQNTELRARIEGLLERCGFSSNGVFVMDGSSRSSHGNAYFSGSGKNKRIVFFDTLIEQLEPEELEAVLAHELGHYRCGHIGQRLCILGGVLLIGFGLLAWATVQPGFFPGLGLPIETQAPIIPALVLLILAGPVLLMYIQPLFSLVSRRHEFQADDFAADKVQAQSLCQALVKLYRHNANTLTPDHWYSTFHDSHPPPPIRIAHLQRTAAV